MSSERLQKYLARAGVASRRHAEELITSGKVQVNNQTVTTLGTKVEPGKDLVTVDGRLVSPPDTPMYFVLYKPPAVVTTLEDPQGRRSIADFAQEPGRRLFPVGRLDYDAEGALLLTDDGELAHQLMHPSYQVPRTYLAKVKGEPTEATLEKLRGGVRLEDGMAQPKVAEVVEKAEKNTWLKIVVTEGRPHLIKRLCAAIGHPVVRLYRPDYAGISAEGLQPGERRALKPEEVQLLKDVASGKVQPQDRMARLPPRRHGRAGVELDDAPEMGGKLFRGAAQPAEDDVPSEPRRDARPAPKERAGGSDRPQRGGKFGDRPARGGGAGERPSRDRGERAERPFRGGFGAGAERPSRGGAFKERSERPFRAGFGADRPARSGAGERSERPARGGGFGERAERPARAGGFGDRSERPARGDRPARAGGFGGRPERPARGGGFGERAERPARGGGFGDRAERPARGGGFGARAERPARGGGFGDRAERPARGGGFGDRAERPARGGGFGDRAERPARGGGFGGRSERPARGGGFGDRAERPARGGGFGGRAGGGGGGGGRFGDRPIAKFGGKPKGAGRFGALPGGDRPPRGGGDRPRGGGPAGGARRTRSWKPHGDKE